MAPRQSLRSGFSNEQTSIAITGPICHNGAYFCMTSKKENRMRLLPAVWRFCGIKFGYFGGQRERRLSGRPVHGRERLSRRIRIEEQSKFLVDVWEKTSWGKGFRLLLSLHLAGICQRRNSAHRDLRRTRDPRLGKSTLLCSKMEPVFSQLCLTNSPSIQLIRVLE